MRHVVKSSPLAFAVLLLMSGCLPRGEDSWEHYVGGGRYQSRTPSVSPDGNAIIFSSPRSGQGDIYRIDIDGEPSTQLTENPAFEANPLYSPNGSIIAFTREAGGKRHIWLMNSDGSNQQPLTSGQVIDDICSFSPDGSKLILARSALTFGFGRHVEYFAANLETKQLRRIEGDWQYSPDGQRIVYGVYEDAFEVWTMAADGSDKRRWTNGTSPRFSPDGKTVLFASDLNQPGRLWKSIRVDDMSERELGRMELPEFTATGDQIVYLSPQWQSEVWRMNPDGTNCQKLDCPSGYIDFLRPCKVGFVFHLQRNGDRVGEIYLIQTADWSVRRVSSMQ